MTVTKDGKTYYFNSKYKNLNYLYAITRGDKKSVDKNLKKQLSFLHRHKLTFNGSDQERSLYDLSYGANIRPDIYFAEMNNRVTSLKQFAESNGFLQPIFITLTAKSEHKPLKQIKLGNTDSYKMVDNPAFNGNPEYVTEAREYLSDSWRKLLQERVFREIKEKYGHRYVFMKTYEPTLDGVPHLHAVLFVPVSFKMKVVKSINKVFSGSLHHVKTDFDDGVGGVVSYIMKYILKSFQNAKTGQLDEVGYWYAKHSIRRFTTSRTLLPLSVYRLIKGKERCRSYIAMSKAYARGDLEVWIKHKDINALLNDSNLMSDYIVDKVVLIHDDNFYLEHYIAYQKNYDYDLEVIPESKHHKMEYKPKDNGFPDFIPVVIDGKEFQWTDQHLFEVKKQPYQMGDAELHKYYYSLDINTVDINHYSETARLMLDRNLMKGASFTGSELESAF